MSDPTFVISIQSQVVFGHVGNSAALFPLQAAGLEVAAIPTVVFSNTPDYPTQRGRPLPADFFADLLLGARERDLARRADFILSGYIGSVEVARLTADFIRDAKAANPALVYLCDPVMGDQGVLYVPRDIADVMRDQLLPLADIVAPNQFELAWLSGVEVATLADVRAARERLHLDASARLVATGSHLAETAPDMIESVLIGPERTSRHPTRRLPYAMPGTGDLYAALIVAGLGRGRDLGAAIDHAQALTARALMTAGEMGAGEVMLTDEEFRRALLDTGEHAAPG